MAEVTHHCQWMCSTLYISVDSCISLYFTVMISSAAETVKKNLTGTEEGSITLPDPVVEFGFLSFGVKTIAMVDDRKVRIVEEIYKDRLLWNNSSGLFTITGLQRNDSGIYKIDSKKGSIVTASYKLTVYGKLHFFCQYTDQCVGGSIALMHPALFVTSVIYLNLKGKVKTFFFIMYLCSSVTSQMSSVCPE